MAEAELRRARLTPKAFAPVRQVATLKVQGITEPQPGHYVFDLGQNMVGWARVHIPVEKDRTVTLHFAEMLNKDGTLYNENYRTAKATDTYTAAATGTIDWQPHFTFHGFRYVELTGLPAGAKGGEAAEGMGDGDGDAFGFAGDGEFCIVEREAEPAAAEYCVGMAGELGGYSDGLSAAR